MLIVLLLAACSSVTPPPAAPPAAEVAPPAAEVAPPAAEPPPAPAGKMTAEAYAACEARMADVRTAEAAHPEARKELLDVALAAQAACRGAHNPDVDAVDALVAKLQAEHDAGAW